MKKTYMQPMTALVEVSSFTLMAGSGNPQASYGGGENGDQHSQTDNIGTAGDGDNFTMESKGHGHDLWEDED